MVAMLIKSYMTVMDSPYIVFWAQRANPIDNSIIRTNITPTQQITLNSKRVLYLNSIMGIDKKHKV